MGKVLVPSIGLTAEYNGGLQVLTLTAVGQVPGYVSNIQFERLISIGGLSFELFGWTGFGVPELKPYKRQQDFVIPNIERVAPGGYVIIVTANHPQGQKVPIRWVGLTGEPTEQPLSLITSSELPKTLDRGTTTIKVLFRSPFDIKESLDVAPGSTLRVQYNDQSLAIQDSGYEDGNMFWTLNSLETGNTQFIVHKTHGLLDTVIRKVYNIEVYVLENAVTAADIQSLSKTSGGVGNAVAAVTWTFPDRLTAAERIMSRTDPTSQLLHVKATQGLGSGQPVHDAGLLTHLFCTFTSEPGTWTMESAGGMNWSVPKFQKGHIVGLVAFRVSDLNFDLEGAVARLRGDGFGLPFWYADLYALFSRAPSDPEYNFYMSDDSILSVDAKSGVIRKRKAVVSLLSAEEEGEEAGEEGGKVGAAAAATTNGSAEGEVGTKRIVEPPPLPPVGVAA